MRRILCSVLAGCILTAAGLVLLESTIHTTASFPKLVSSALIYPGYALAFVLALGRFHDVTLPVIAAANVVVYSAAAYVSIVLLSKLKVHRKD